MNEPGTPYLLPPRRRSIPGVASSSSPSGPPTPALVGLIYDNRLDSHPVAAALLGGVQARISSLH